MSSAEGPDLRTAVVFGATGAQGGSVIDHLLRGGTWRVRGVSRNPAGPAAQRMTARGVEMVRGDLDDPGVGDQVLPGADALFLVSNFWEPQQRGEYEQGRAVIDAALRHGITNIVYSSLPGVWDITGGALDVPHYEGKFSVEKHYRDAGAPVAFVHPGWYYQNWLEVPLLKLFRDVDGVATFANTLRNGSLPILDIRDLGGVVARMLADRESYYGVTVPVISELRTSDQIAETFSRVLGETVRHRPKSAAEYSVDEPTRDLAQMFEFFDRHAADCWGDGTVTRLIYPAMKTFETWATESVPEIRAALDPAAN
ncbi:NmrA/HSCARG family protein [Nocardia inohanensis]|uniref:NmrA/HSCARG family protein n=1 Tax=Nocardia inohanensis TaxID=209246 RepID=UPI00082B8847|nr:NmrA/HSCARG family protein [Nocardia inohanensis]